MCTWCWRESNAQEEFGRQNVAKEILSVIYYTHRHAGRHFAGGAENICPENNNLPKLHRSLPIEYTLCTEHFFIVQDFWATWPCTQKQSLPRIFSLYWIYVLHSGFLSNLHLPRNISSRGGVADPTAPLPRTPMSIPFNKAKK